MSVGLGTVCENMQIAVELDTVLQNKNSSDEFNIFGPSMVPFVNASTGHGNSDSSRNSTSMGSTNLRLSLVGSIYLYKNNNNFENIFLTNSAVNGTKVIWSG